MSADVLVIDSGSGPRGADGVGPRIAEAVAAWGRPGVQAITARRLTPELSARLSNVDRVVFVDAAPAVEGVEVWPLSPASGSAAWGHIIDPCWLLALTEAVYGKAPAGWLLTVPALSLAVGAVLSDEAVKGADEALRLIERLIGETGVGAGRP